MFTRWVVLLRSVPLLPHNLGEEGQARTVLALRITASARAAHLIGLAAQECRDVEQVIFLAQIRSVVRLQGREPGLHAWLGGGFCGLGGGPGCRLRRGRASAAHSGYP